MCGYYGYRNCYFGNWRFNARRKLWGCAGNIGFMNFGNFYEIRCSKK